MYNPSHAIVIQVNTTDRDDLIEDRSAQLLDALEARIELFNGADALLNARTFVRQQSSRYAVLKIAIDEYNRMSADWISNNPDPDPERLCFSDWDHILDEAQASFRQEIGLTLQDLEEYEDFGPNPDWIIRSDFTVHS